MDLRTAYYHDSAAAQTGSSLQFATLDGGDLAATLGPYSTWVTGQNDDIGSDSGDLDVDFPPVSASEQPICELG